MKPYHVVNLTRQEVVSSHDLLSDARATLRDARAAQPPDVADNMFVVAGIETFLVERMLYSDPYGLVDYALPERHSDL